MWQNNDLHLYFDHVVTGSSVAFLRCHHLPLKWPVWLLDQISCHPMYQVYKIKVVQFGLHGWNLCCQVLDEMTKASELFLGLSAGNFLKKLPECLFTLEILRSDCWFSLLAATQFLVHKWWEFGVRSREQLQPDKFVYSHYLFTRYCMGIIGRS